jgi:hypothetical protein
MAETDGLLTDEQIENWRKVMMMQFGPIALILPKEEIQLFRDRLQKAVDENRIK